VSAQLAHAAAGGDDDALAEMVRLYHDRVYRFGLRVCRDGHDADDAVQEAFVKLAVRPDVVAHQGALSWLMTVVRNACRRMLRPFARRRRLADAGAEDVAPAEVPDARAAMERFELVRRVHAGIAELAEPYRRVLVLRDLEGLSGEDTAAALGLTLASMKTRLHRARAMLRSALRAADPDERAG
jgi:RNA polymerase sigma-70 factor (ECF subfamily)